MSVYGGSRSRSRERPRILFSRRAALTAVCIVVTGALVAAVYMAVSPRPLLEEHFNGGSLSPARWEKQRDVAVVENGHLRLVNRGSIVTVAEFEEPVSVSLRWMWKDLTEGKEKYSDSLTVGLRTTGKHADTRRLRVARRRAGHCPRPMGHRQHLLAGAGWKYDLFPAHGFANSRRRLA